ncbi:hypothetical protein AVEN_214623-1 [Araneus ventricosus]|uniref:DDE-1 domain-containing protein n=1 Tax=Araneus ventricosus TaxID=182803 RepID=A0A4Y2GPE5_ARAVE|nr:hypothetical protein AVEN_214623-1 [Araneus ventricosus]
MDQGIIRCVKVNYRKFIMQSLLANTKTASNASDIIISVIVLDAVMWSSKAWKEISKQTIQKCFVEANFPANVCIEKHSSTEDIDVRDIQILLNNGNFSDMSAKEFISIDNDILTEVPIDNVNDIIQRHTNNDSSDDDECNINDDISNKEELSIKSYGSFLDTVSELEKFALSQGDTEMLALLKNTTILMERRIIRKRFVQKTMLDYFKM